MVESFLGKTPGRTVEAQSPFCGRGPGGLIATTSANTTELLDKKVSLNFNGISLIPENLIEKLGQIPEKVLTDFLTNIGFSRLDAEMYGIYKELKEGDPLKIIIGNLFAIVRVFLGMINFGETGSFSINGPKQGERLVQSGNLSSDGRDLARVGGYKEKELIKELLASVNNGMGGYRAYFNREKPEEGQSELVFFKTLRLPFLTSDGPMTLRMGVDAPDSNSKMRTTSFGFPYDPKKNHLYYEILDFQQGDFDIYYIIDRILSSIPKSLEGFQTIKQKFYIISLLMSYMLKFSPNPIVIMFGAKHIIPSESYGTIAGMSTDQIKDFFSKGILTEILYGPIGTPFREHVEKMVQQLKEGGSYKGERFTLIHYLEALKIAFGISLEWTSAGLPGKQSSSSTFAQLRKADISTASSVSIPEELLPKIAPAVRKRLNRPNVANDTSVDTSRLLEFLFQGVGKS